MTEKEFFKIIDDYYIKIGDDSILLNLHKPSDIRALIYIINQKQSFTELQCEYNNEEID